jgi:hypothetical protein
VALPKIQVLHLQRSPPGRRYKRLPLRRLMWGQKERGICGSIECAMDRLRMMRKLIDVRQFQTITVNQDVLLSCLSYKHTSLSPCKRYCSARLWRRGADGEIGIADARANRATMAMTIKERILDVVIKRMSSGGCNFEVE